MALDDHNVIHYIKIMYNNIEHLYSGCGSNITLL